MTVPEAAEVLGYTVQHTRLLLRQGRLTGEKLGRDWLVYRAVVIDYNVRKENIPLFADLSKRGRPTTGKRANIRQIVKPGRIQ